MNYCPALRRLYESVYVLCRKCRIGSSDSAMPSAMTVGSMSSPSGSSMMSVT
ncbi:hypothetical protein [Paenibacillus vortex]|uniref:hypothetical protein n=1 Tax=Paenibacillus vortex TaxID=71995 RepID=UPI001F34F372|nr:hypothetical protein [Paenibacillus vortex]